MAGECTVKILVYGHVDLNIIDGSAVWAVSLAQTLAQDPTTQVTVLLKKPLRRDILVEPLKQIANVSLLDPWQDYTLDNFIKEQLPTSWYKGELTAGDAVRLIAALDSREPFDLFVVRGFDVALQASRYASIALRTWAYITDFPQRKEELGHEHVQLLSRIVRSVRYMACQTEDLRNYFMELTGAPESKFILLPPMVPPLPAALSQREFVGRRRKLCYAGKFAPAWNVEEMINLLSHVQRYIPDVELHIAGDKFHKPPSDPQFPFRLRHLLEHTPGVVWYGALSREEVQGLIADCDVGLSWRAPEMDENLEFSTKVLEYGLYGKPVVLNRTRVHERILGSDYPLYANSPEEFVSAVVEALRSDEVYHQAATRLRQVAAEHTFPRVWDRIRPYIEQSQRPLELQYAIEAARLAGDELEQYRQREEELKRQLELLEKDYVAVVAELEKVRNSFSFRLGHALVLAVRRPGRNTLALPVRLFRLLLERSQGNRAIRHQERDGKTSAPIVYVPRSDILVVTNHYPDYSDLYRNAFVHRRVLGYKRCGLSVDVFRFNRNLASFGPRSYEFDGVDVFTGYAKELDAALRTGNYHTVLVHFLNVHMWRVLSKYLNKVRIIVWLHGIEVQPWYRRAFNYKTDEEKQRAIESSERLMQFWRKVFSTDTENLHFVFVSRYFASEVMTDVGVVLPEQRYSIIHNFIDTDLFTYEEKPVEQRKKILSIRPFASPKYANDLTVAAILELAQEPFFSDLEFRIVGDGPLFSETVAPLRKYPNVILERRFLRQTEIAALQKEYGVFLCPTRWDSQGVSRDEAMASGLVPVTTRVAGVPEFVDEHCGILAEPEDAHGLAEGIRRLYHDPELFRQLSQAAAERVRRQSGFAQTIQAEVDLIRKGAPILTRPWR